jgi:Mycobacterium membrane protein
MFRPGYAALPRPPEPGPNYAPSYGPGQYGPDHPGTRPFAAPAGDPPPGYGQPYPGVPAGYDHPPPGYGPPGYGPPGYGPPGYGAPPAYGPAPRRRSNVPLVALILAVTVLLCGGAVTAGVMVVNAVKDRAEEAIKPITEPTLPQLPTEAPDLPGMPSLPGTSGRTITVTYEVTGDGPVQIGYVDKPGEPKRVAEAKLPWKETTTLDSPAFLLVSAVREDTGSGTVRCRISVDGEEVAQSSRDGGFATVACSKWVLD